jgi:2-iminobutanoate/2-iminopropanoate deaminase
MIVPRSQKQIELTPQAAAAIEVEAGAYDPASLISAILKAAGSDMGHVLKMTVYVSDISLWGAVNEVYKSVMGDARPARAVVTTGELHYGFLIEIEAIAATRDEP